MSWRLLSSLAALAGLSVPRIHPVSLAVLRRFARGRRGFASVRQDGVIVNVELTHSGSLYGGDQIGEVERAVHDRHPAISSASSRTRFNRCLAIALPVQAPWGVQCFLSLLPRYRSRTASTYSMAVHTDLFGRSDLVLRVVVCQFQHSHESGLNSFHGMTQDARAV
jgi:hypothetical protein